jgi:hypothetical protein
MPFAAAMILKVRDSNIKITVHHVDNDGDTICTIRRRSIGSEWDF